MRFYPYLTERILVRAKSLAPLVELAILHQERLDGSGYHRRLSGNMLSLTARVLAAADAYHAMTEPRPYRTALLPDETATELRQVSTPAGATLFAMQHNLLNAFDQSS